MERMLQIGQSGESDTIPDDNSIAPLPENVKMDAKFSLSEDIAPVDNTVDNVDKSSLLHKNKNYNFGTYRIKIIVLICE